MSRLFGGTNTPPYSLFQIRVDDNHLTLRGSRSEAPRVVLRGNVVLTTKEHIKTQAVRLVFAGHLRAGYHQTYKGKVCRHDAIFYSDTKTLFSPVGKQTGLSPGNYDWPFEFIIEGNKPESLEGLPHSWITYRLKATVERGVFAKDYVEKQHIRLIRSVDTSSLETSHSMVVDNTWPEKIKYNLSTPSKAVLYGSAVRVDFQLVPLLKGLRIGKIYTHILEERTIRIPYTADVYCPQNWDEPAEIVCEDVYEIPEDTETQNCEGMEGYRFSRRLPLPRNLKLCRQSFDHHHITIEHQLRFILALHNPAGHTSELRCKLPLRLVMPAIARMNNEQELVAGQSTVNTLANEMLPPPMYGKHFGDQIYNEIDIQYLMTPGPSGPVTPSDISRSGSGVGLNVMDGTLDNQVALNTLRNRLSGLTTGPAREPSDNSATGHQSSQESIDEPSEAHSSDFNASGYFSTLRNNPAVPPACSRPNSSGRSSPFVTTGIQTPVHLEYNSDELCRVPSYRTAVTSNMRTTWSSDLPSYQKAISRPVTPQNTSPNISPGLEISTTGSIASSPSEEIGSRTRRVHYTADTRGSDT